MNATTLEGWATAVDRYGKAGWIALMVLGFVLFWPIGLALLAYLIWSGRMGCKGNQNRNWMCGGHRRHRQATTTFSSGNSAFDEYREQTIRRLEEEQTEFTSFLDHLRKAKDKAEFDQFMSERTSQQPPTDKDGFGTVPKTT